MKFQFIHFAVILVLIIAFPEISFSNERRFGYAYESSVLPIGARELELWNTDRRGRTYFYHRLDQRIEYEFGVADNLMSAFYFNATTRTKDSNEESVGGSKSTSYSVSISSEWKYKVMDRVADPFGFALYGEGTVGTDKLELEGKLIFDKQIQQMLYAFDFVGEYESTTNVVNGSVIDDVEYKIKSDVGGAYIFSNGFGAGLELRSENIFVSGALTHSSLFAGATVSYAAHEMWATISILPQIHSFKGGTTISQNLDLDEFEKIQTRLLLSFHF
ncbi:MAG: hypothetical protein WDA22_07645 [Bacteroidota bacterium]